MGKQDHTPIFTLASSTTHLLHRAQQIAVNLSAAALETKGLTIRQFAVLAALNDCDGQTQSSLVEITGIDRSTLADMVARMEKGGMVQRVTSNEDARAKAVSLTRAGRAAFNEAAPVVQAADYELIAQLRKSRRVSLLESLMTIGDGTPVVEDQPAKKVKKHGKDDKKKKKKKK
jgi:DNA-binding MarR family transcriptional regulator